MKLSRLITVILVAFVLFYSLPNSFQGNDSKDTKILVAADIHTQETGQQPEGFIDLLLGYVFSAFNSISTTLAYLTQEIDKILSFNAQSYTTAFQPAPAQDSTKDSSDISTLLERVSNLESLPKGSPVPNLSISKLPKGVRYTDLIGNSIIDSFGNIYPANGITASIGTPWNRYDGIYANNFSVDADGNLAVGGGSTFGDATVRGNLYASNIYYSGSASDAIFLGGIAADGGSLTTTATTFNLINSNATTVNFAGAATSLSIGSSSGTTTINNNLVVTGTTSDSGGISLPNGSAAVPALNFTNNTNAGLYRLDSNSIGLITNGSATSGITINGGLVGIGVTSPNNPLEIRSTTSPQLRVAYDGSTYATLAVSSGNNTTLAMPAGVLSLNAPGGVGITGNSLYVQTGSTQVFSVTSNGHIITRPTDTSGVEWYMYGSSDNSTSAWRIAGSGNELRWEANTGANGGWSSAQESFRFSGCGYNGPTSCGVFINQPGNGLNNIMFAGLAVSGYYDSHRPVLVLSAGTSPGHITDGNLITAYTDDDGTTTALSLNNTGSALTLGATNPTINASATGAGNTFSLTANKIALGSSSNKFVNLMPTGRLVVGGSVSGGQGNVANGALTVNGTLVGGSSQSTSIDFNANMITNGSFESFSGSPSSPTGWSRGTFCQGSSNVQSSTAEAQDGQFAMAMTVVGGNCSTYSSSNTGIFQNLPTLKAGRTYVIKVMGRVDTNAEGYVAILNGSDSVLASTIINSTTLGTYTFTYAPGVSDVTGARMVIMGKSGPSSYTLYVDSLTMGSGVETGINIASGWDTDIKFGSSTPTLSIANAGTLKVTDGTNTLFNVADSGTTGTISTGVITTTGNVGIGTTSPISKLNVSDGNSVNTALYNSAADFINLSYQDTAPGFNLISASGTDGTTAGNRGVFKATRSRGTLAAPTVVGSGDSTFSLLGAGYDGSATAATAGITFVVDGSVTTGTVPQRIIFETGATNTRTERVRIDNAGNLILGTAQLANNATDGFLYIQTTTSGAPSGTPTAYSGRVATVYDDTNNKLYFYNGAWKSSTAYSDFAEWAPAKGAEIGDLVSTTSEKNPIVDDTAPFMLSKSQASYDSKIIGVVSKYAEESNMAYGFKKSADYHAIALTGRVPVKVSTENGAITSGDYLTSSSIPGVAMKATHAGMIIGKATEGYSGSGVGMVIVFVQPSFADPTDTFANLSFDSEGSLVTSSIKTNNLSLVSPSSEIQSINNQSVADMKQSLATHLDRLDSLEKKIDSQSEQISSLSKQLKEQQDKIASYSATALVPSDFTKLIASGSAIVKSSDDLSGGSASYDDLSVSNSFKSMGKNVLGDTLIAGSFSVNGSLKIDMVDNGSNINSIGTLYLQNSPLANSFDLFNGKVTVDKNGNIQTQGMVVATQVSTDKLTITKTIGEATISAGETSVTISSDQITDKSNIFTTLTSSSGGQPLIISGQNTGKDFTVSIDHAYTKDVKFKWWIVDNK